VKSEKRKEKNSAESSKVEGVARNPATEGMRDESGKPRRVFQLPEELEASGFSLPTLSFRHPSLSRIRGRRDRIVPCAEL